MASQVESGRPVSGSTSDSGDVASHDTGSSLEKRGGEVAISAAVAQSDRVVQPASARNGSVRDVETVRPKARPGLSWPITACFMIAYNISAGVMTLANVFTRMGLVAGILLVLAVGLTSGYTAYTQWRAIMRYAHVNTYPDVLALLFGKTGRVLGHITMSLLYLFIATIHILLGVQEWNTLTDHATCGMTWSIVSSSLGFCFTMFRTLREGYGMAVGAVLSIMGAVVITMVGVAAFGPESPMHHLFVPETQTSLWKISAAISSIVFTFTGHIAYPQFIEGMQNPRDFPKALVLNQSAMMIVYTVVAAVLYWCGGQDITTPALDSAPKTFSKVAWGLASFTILIAAVIPMNLLTHNVSSVLQSWQKSWRRDGKGEETMPAGSPKSKPVPWKRWIPLAAAAWIVAWVVAEGIPVFGSLIALVGAALGCWITFGFGAVLWFRIDADGSNGTSRPLGDGSSLEEQGLPAVEGTPDRKADKLEAPAQRASGHFGRQALGNARRRPWTAAMNASILVACVLLMGLGMYGSITEIRVDAHHRKPFSCGNND